MWNLCSSHVSLSASQPFLQNIHPRRTHVGLNLVREMLMSALRALVKNLVKKSFDITFIGNEKNYQNINYFFSFPIKIFFNWILNQYSKDTR